MIRFLCLGGFRRLSAMMRSAGGDPAFSRAIRRASPPAVNLFFAFLRVINGSEPSTQRDPLRRRYRFTTVIVTLDGYCLEWCTAL